MFRFEEQIFLKIYKLSKSLLFTCTTNMVNLKILFQVLNFFTISVKFPLCSNGFKFSLFSLKIDVHLNTARDQCPVNFCKFAVNNQKCYKIIKK